MAQLFSIGFWMRKIYFLIVLVIVAFAKTQAQSWTWSTSVQYRDATKRVCRDAANNIYLFKNYNYYNTESDTIKKIDALGNLLWQYTLPQNTALTNLVTTQDTGFYLAGTYFGTVTISNQTITGSESINIWFAKYNSAGALQWIRTLGGKADDILGDICVRGTGFVITGALGDTVQYMGQTFPKSKQKELFVATLDANGILQSMKIATGTNTVYSNGQKDASSWGYDCEVDGNGNIYILASAFGDTKFDTLTIGKWGSDYSWPYLTTSLLKLNGSLSPVFKHIYSQCQNYCYPYDNLTVNSAGESYTTYHWSYGQSGNDYQSSTIYHVNALGTLSNTFVLNPQDKSDINDLDTDSCGNLYFAGYWYTHWYDSTFTGVCVVGQLNTNLQVNWIFGDTSLSKSPRATALCKLTGNDIFVTGFLMDTTICQQGAFPNGNISASFFASVSGPSDKVCNNIAGYTPKTTKKKSFNIYPNPSSGIFLLGDELQGCDIKVYSSTGELLKHEPGAGKELSLNSFSQGVYFVRVTSQSGQAWSTSLIVSK